MKKFLKIKRKLPELLVEEGFFENLDIANRNIIAGNIVLNEKKVDKVGTIIDISKPYELRLKNSVMKYVSRGGLKLEKAIEDFSIDFKNKIVLDVGASTGGFTDCSLKNGAKFVYAIDVGTNQLNWSLRNNEKVKSIEKMHIKNLTKDNIDFQDIDVIVMDVSFISIKTVIPYLIKFINENTDIIFLIKPQFEVDNKYLEKGIVKSKEKRIEVIFDIISYAKEYGLLFQNITLSPIKGAKGNVEYLVYFSKKTNSFSEKILSEKIKSMEDTK